MMVRPDSPNYGRFVTVICEWDGRSTPTGNPYEYTEHWTWVVTGNGLVIPSGADAGIRVPWHIAEDRYLKPIRDQPGEDETLTWAGKPEQEGIAWG